MDIFARSVPFRLASIGADPNPGPDAEQGRIGPLARRSRLAYRWRREKGWNDMTILVILGAVLVAAGLVGLAQCVRVGYAIKREKPTPDVARARLNRLLAINLGSVCLAAMGLGMIVIGLVL